MVRHADIVYCTLRNADRPLTCSELGKMCGLTGNQVEQAIRRRAWAVVVGRKTERGSYHARLIQFSKEDGEVVARVVAQRIGKCSNAACDNTEIFCRGLCVRCYVYQKRNGRMWKPGQAKEPNAESITFRLPATIKNRLEARAHRDRCSLGEVIRRLLTEATK